MTHEYLDTETGRWFRPSAWSWLFRGLCHWWRFRLGTIYTNQITLPRGLPSLPRGLHLGCLSAGCAQGLPALGYSLGAGFCVSGDYFEKVLDTAGQKCYTENVRERKLWQTDVDSQLGG